eukprot:TRINITY_DN12307_c0_g1_i1.p1 TRINITY_DN12307_c0_g1~~TRINITY_DN12307_c0_g1_i1.p1  ORF type:complete len:256 (+),score=17.84 TRINITY_DN12307_c0_g1_i1:113-769(+)
MMVAWTMVGMPYWGLRFLARQRTFHASTMAIMCVFGGFGCGALHETGLYMGGINSHPVTYAFSTYLTATSIQAVGFKTPISLAAITSFPPAFVALLCVYGTEYMQTKGLAERFELLRQRKASMEAVREEDRRLYGLYCLSRNPAFMAKEAEKAKKPHIDDFRNDAGQIDRPAYTKALSDYYAAPWKLDFGALFNSDVPVYDPNQKIADLEKILDKYRK